MKKCVLYTLFLNAIHLAEWQVVVLVLQEVYVSGRDDAHQLAAHFTIVCDGNATEAMACFGLEDVPHALPGAHHHRVCDEALLVPLEAGREEVRKKRDGVGINTKLYGIQLPKQIVCTN